MSETPTKSYFHNPFEETTCKKCGHHFDSLKPTCPKCHEQSDNPRANPLNEVTFTNPFIEIILFLMGWQGIKVFAQIIRNIIKEMVRNGSIAEGEANMALQYSVYGVLFVVLLGIASVYLPKLFKSFLKPEALWGILVCVAVLTFDISWGRISSSLGATINENQDAINDITKINIPLAILFLAFIGPMCEELTYRVGLFNFTRRFNRVVGYIVASIIFGLIHIHDYGSVNEWLSYPSYAFAGLAFAFAYEKWGLGASFLAHFLVNFLAILSNTLQ